MWKRQRVSAVRPAADMGSWRGACWDAVAGRTIASPPPRRRVPRCVDWSFSLVLAEKKKKRKESLTEAGALAIC